mgnify:FL=1|jgi:hypothetical protein
MVGGEAQGINVKIELPNREDAPAPSSRIQPLTQDTIVRWVRVQDYLDDKTQDDLITLAKGYPDSALKSFKDNFNLMIMRVRENRAKEIE